MEKTKYAKQCKRSLFEPLLESCVYISTAFGVLISTYILRAKLVVLQLLSALHQRWYVCPQTQKIERINPTMLTPGLFV